jgi:hypothetical protein
LPNTYNTCELEGYLFVCPAEEFQLGPDSFQWPYRPAYWSLSPSGTFPLSTEDANMLRFPIIHIETCIVGLSWDDGFYNALRRFQQGKGLNPKPNFNKLQLMLEPKARPKISSFGYILESATNSLISPSFRVGLPWFVGHSFRIIMVQLVIGPDFPSILFFLPHGMGSLKELLYLNLVDHLVQ